MADAYAAARAFIRQHHPDARVAFLGGSAATGAATSTSDLDIFVLLGEADDDVAYVEATTHEDWLVEAFVYGPAAAELWMQKGRDERRPVLDSLVATGVALTDNDETRARAGRARAALAAGPRAADPAGDDHGLLGWAAGLRDPQDLAAICRTVLDAVGGYLQPGFVRGQRPGSREQATGRRADV